METTNKPKWSQAQWPKLLKDPTTKQESQMKLLKMVCKVQLNFNFKNIISGGHSTRGCLFLIS